MEFKDLKVGDRFKASDGFIGTKVHSNTAIHDGLECSSGFVNNDTVEKLEDGYKKGG